MKNYILIASVLLPVSAFGYCPLPSMTGNQAVDQRAQMAYQNCVNNQQYQQQQLQIQQQQLQVQQQQLQLQQQQSNQIQPSQPNYNLLQPIRTY